DGWCRRRGTAVLLHPVAGAAASAGSAGGGSGARRVVPPAPEQGGHRENCSRPVLFGRVVKKLIQLRFLQLTDDGGFLFGFVFMNFVGFRRDAETLEPLHIFTGFPVRCRQKFFAVGVSVGTRQKGQCLHLFIHLLTPR